MSDNKISDTKMSDAKTGATSKVDPKLLEILVCPLTKGPLRYDAAAQELISDRAGLLTALFEMAITEGSSGPDTPARH